MVALILIKNGNLQFENCRFLLLFYCFKRLCEIKFCLRIMILIIDTSPLKAHVNNTRHRSVS